VEYSAVATVIQFWNTEINPAAWIALAMGICVFLNVVAVKWYGESEFIMASLKVLLLFGLVMYGPPSFTFWNVPECNTLESVAGD
jgi:amino acid transporter